MSTTFVIVLMLVIGRMRSLTGGVVGTIAYSVVCKLLRRFQESSPLGIDLPAGTAKVLAVLALTTVTLHPG